MKKLSLYLVILVFASIFANAQTTPNNYVTAIKKAQDSVVSIYVYQNDSVDIEQNYSNPKLALGSGIVFDPKGYIVTNNHVVKDRKQVLVEFLDGSVYIADVVERNSIADLVMLRVQENKKTFKAIVIADSDKLELGEQVVAIGNPFGIGLSASSGIVSAITPRTSGLITSYVGTLVQTDAATNPGNSGGPLINLRGELIGINNSIFSKKGEFNGISLAIPSNVAEIFYKKAMQGRALRSSWIGATVLGIDQVMADALGLSNTRGVVVADVYPQGPASISKLRKGDVILSINNTEVRNHEHFVYIITSLNEAQEYEVVFFRRDKKFLTKISLEAPPEDPIRNLASIPYVNGMVIANSSPAVAIELSYPYSKKGVVVYDVATRSLPHKLGIKAGDFIVSIDGKKVFSVSQVMDYFAQNVINLNSGTPLKSSFSVVLVRGVDEYEVTFETK